MTGIRLFGRAATLAIVASVTLSGAALGQARDTTRRGTARPDSTRRDTTVARLPIVQVMGSILPIAGPAIGSGIPARVSVTTGAEIDAWEPRLLSNALARQPGVSLYDDLGSLYKTTLVTRGFTASPVVGLPQGVSVFLDGVPVNEPDAGQVNFDLLPLEHVGQVEFLSGTASLLGPNSLGGAVNLVTRRGPSVPGGEVEVAVGSHETYSVELSHGGPAVRGWRYYAGGGYGSEGGWRQVTGARQLNGFVNVGRAGQSSGVNFQAFAANALAETAGSLPFSVYSVRPDSNLSAEDFEDLTQVHLALSGYRRLGSGQGSAMLYFRHSDAERFNVNQVSDPDVRSFSDNRSVGGSADWRTARTARGGTLGLRFGLGGSANRSEVQIFAERIDPGLTTDVESPIAKLDAYALADYAVGRVTLSGGLRYDLVRIPFRNQLDPTRDTTSTYQRLSPRGGVSVSVGPAGSIYVSAGQSFRAPALIELACADPLEPCPLPFALGDDPPLDPVIATTYEIGGQWRRGALDLSVSAYRTDVRDDIFLFPYNDENEPEGSSIDGYFANLGATRRQGMELGSRASFGQVVLYANYAYTRATFEVDDVQIFSIREEGAPEDVEVNEVEEGDRLPLVPDHTVSLGASVDLSSGIQLGADARYTGKRWLRGDEANEETPLDGYWVTDLRAGYELAGWEIAAIVRNVFDAEFATFGTFNINQGAGDVLERFLTPSAPRTFQLVLRRQIGRGGIE